MLQVVFVFVFVLRWVVGGGGCWEVGGGCWVLATKRFQSKILPHKSDAKSLALRSAEASSLTGNSGSQQGISFIEPFKKYYLRFILQCFWIQISYFWIFWS